MVSRENYNKTAEATFRAVFSEIVILGFRFLGRFFASLFLPATLVVILLISDLLGLDADFIGPLLVFIALSYLLVVGYYLYQFLKIHVPKYFEVCTPPFCGEKFTINGREYEFSLNHNKLGMGVSKRQIRAVREREIASVMFAVHFLVGSSLVYILSQLPDSYESYTSTVSDFLNIFPWFIKDIYWGLMAEITPYSYETIKTGKGAEFTVSWIVLGPVLLAFAIAVVNYIQATVMAFHEDPDIWE